MVDDGDAYGFLGLLEANAAALRDEVLTLDASDFVPMAATETYGGRWTMFPLVLGRWAVEFPTVDLAANLRRCPTAATVLGALGAARIAGFMRLDPGAEILSHTDPRDDDVVRCHVGLVLPAHERTWWPELTARLMDVRLPHGARNPSERPRYTFLVDVALPFVVPTGELPWRDGDPVRPDSGR